MIQARLNLVVALPAEARPINQILGLQRVQPARVLPLYHGNDIALITSGHGMNAVQASVRYLHDWNDTDNVSWVNIGIAGHADLPLGEAIFASKVVAPADQQSWNLITPPCKGVSIGNIQTVTEPVTDYPGDSAYDMEAAGFVSAALEFAPLCRIQVVKIISDNRNNPTQAINARMIKQLIQQQSALIRQLVNRM